MIYSVTDYSTPFVLVTIPPAIKAVAKHFSHNYKIYSHEDFKQRKLYRDEGYDVVWVIEAEYLACNNLSVEEFRMYFPNGKIVLLGSDTFFHISRGTFQVNHPSQVDLWLDLMQSCAQEYSQYTQTDTWAWSSCGQLNNYLEEFVLKNSDIQPEIDFISVLGLHTINKEGSYRKQMIDFIRDNGWTFTRGDSDGYNDPDLDKLYRSYLRSWFTLGTTSHDNGMRSAKGFRDTVGIMLARPLLYDWHEDTFRDYPESIFYEYDNLPTLLDLAEKYLSDTNLYQKKLHRQQEWAKTHTIEQQFIRLFPKYGIIR